MACLMSTYTLSGRATQGVRLINLEKRNDEIASVCKVLSQTDEEIAKEKAEREASEARIKNEHTIENTDFEDVSDDMDPMDDSDETTEN